MKAWALLLVLAAGCAPASAPAPSARGNTARPASLTLVRPGERAAAPIRAAYLYHYIDPAHADTLAEAGFDRALVKFIGDSLGPKERARLARWMERGRRGDIEIVPSWALQTRTRLPELGTSRRYTPREGSPQAHVACPLDSLFWNDGLLVRGGELLSVSPAPRRLLLDLEIYTGEVQRVPHYDRGPCRCRACLREFRDARTLLPLEAWQEQRLDGMFRRMLGRFAARHPGVELGVFDLDLESFVHRAFARGLVANRIPTADYCEKSYRGAADRIAHARERLKQLGVDAPILAGVLLGHFSPDALPSAIRSVSGGADGWFLFTTYSLWADPQKRTGDYALQGPPEAYWRALKTANREVLGRSERALPGPARSGRTP